MENYCTINKDNPDTFDRCKTCMENTATGPEDICEHLQINQSEIMSSPIFIPSKSRVDNCNFIKYLALNNTPATIVLEKEDFEKYKKSYPKFDFIILPESNRGITYVRNFIKQYTEDANISQFWMIDDDVSSFYKRVDARMIRIGVDALIFAEEQLKGYALGALDYQQLAWSATKNWNENSFCDVCVLVDNEQTFGLRYRAEMEGKEDRDFAMQVVRVGKKTARTTLYAFDAPTNGSNTGGLKETFYDMGLEKKCIENMIKEWGMGICTPIVKKNGRQDIKINWKLIAQKQTTIF